MWSVHSYEGDYNPLHDHGGNTPLGLSSISLSDGSAGHCREGCQFSHGGAPKMSSASGNCDGFTQLV